MILLRRWIDVRLLTLLTLVVSIAAVDSQVFAQLMTPGFALLEPLNGLIRCGVTPVLITPCIFLF